MISSWALQVALELTPGTHTIQIAAAGAGVGASANATVSGNNTSVNQGALNVTVIKL
jgi:hypothetical protein